MERPKDQGIRRSWEIKKIIIPLIGLAVWIWATLYREDRGWGFSDSRKRELILEGEVKELIQQVTELSQRLALVENTNTAEFNAEEATKSHSEELK